MAFIAMFFVGVAILALILGFLFLLGSILLIVGIVRRRKPKNAGKKSPTVCIVLGAVCLLPPVGVAIYIAVSLVISHFSGLSESETYDHVTDGWRSGKYIGDNRAREEAIEGLLTSADAGDRDYFEKMFSRRLQEKEGFGEAIDAFFESYPNGLSFCELDGRYGGDNTKWHVSTANAYYTCVLDGEWYYMELELCYENTDSPDDVGVTFFCIENLEAYALDRDYSKDEFLVCEIVDESEVTARLIDGRGYSFTPTPDRSITVEQMKSYLEKYSNLKVLAGRIGAPNASKEQIYRDSKGKKNRNSRGDKYYYELVPENGEPRYAYIRADYISGEIYWYYICSDVGKLPD